jgi:hypothetical protein
MIKSQAITNLFSCGVKLDSIFHDAFRWQFCRRYLNISEIKEFEHIAACFFICRLGLLASPALFQDNCK